MILGNIVPAALANHLWQSTLFVAAAAVLALSLRKNRAQTRYALWLIATLKFLVPFSLLIAVGAHLRWPAAAPVARPRLSVAVQQIGQPFTAPEISTSVSMPAVSNASSPVITILFSIWLVGFAAVLFSWWRRWMRVRAIVRAAAPLSLQVPVPVLSSPTLLEPGVFGIFRPVLLLPEGITRHLSPTQLASILAHELCHVRRRDNLAAAIHMFVEALFWFHPLVWWIGVRMVEERERACDEEVLRLGNQPRVYAESILKTCQFYLESPLACVSGVTGSDLKKRIVRIMTQRVATRLDLRKKLLLTAAAMAIVAVPILVGMISAADVRAQSQPGVAQSAGAIMPKFEVASIKRNASVWSDPTRHPMGVRMEPGGRLHAQNAPLMLLIQRAYRVQAFQVIGGPAWINTDGYDIEAKPEDNTDRKQMWLMLQTLLADRFKLALHGETRELPIYDLEVAKGGPKLPAPKAATCISRSPGAPPKPSEAGQTDCGYVAGPYGSTGLLRLEGSKVHIADVINKLELVLGRPVLDKTEFTRYFSLNLSFTADEATIGLPGYGGPGDPGGTRPPEDSDQPNIFSALKEQLGLKLVSGKGPVEVLVIDHVERPTAN
jgi:uncharacterized protein (TIGR03435 family)